MKCWGELLKIYILSMLIALEGMYVEMAYIFYNSLLLAVSVLV